MYQMHPEYEAHLARRRKVLGWAKKIAGELAFCVPTCLVVHWVLEKFQ